MGDNKDVKASRLLKRQSFDNKVAHISDDRNT